MEYRTTASKRKVNPANKTHNGANQASSIPPYTMERTSVSNILIIGAGTWGCSIALELARRGYTGIKVLDGSPFPSAISAGNDLNKIAEECKTSYKEIKNVHAKDDSK